MCCICDMFIAFMEFCGGVSSNGFDATMVSPYPDSGGGSKSAGVGGGVGWIVLFAADAAVFRRFFG